MGIDVHFVDLLGVAALETGEFEVAVAEELLLGADEPVGADEPEGGRPGAGVRQPV